jgi:hypothetical protein
MDIIGRNPCEAVTRPSLQRSDAKAIAPEEVTRLLDRTRTNRREKLGYVRCGARGNRGV